MDRDELDSPPEKFPKLDETVINCRWTTPILLGRTLESLLNESLDDCNKNMEDQSQTCLNLFPERLTLVFTQILNDDKVDNWAAHTHHNIYEKCGKLVELCVGKLDEDWFPLLNLLAMVLNPDNQFHKFNAVRTSQSVTPGTDIPDEKLYARPLRDRRNPRGWLVDLLNRFGNLGGFVILLSRFQPGRRKLTIPMIEALLRPFGLCHELLTVYTIDRYLIPILERVQEILSNLTDEELTEEAKNLSINRDISATINAMRSLAARLPASEDLIRNLESLGLRMKLRLLHIVQNIDEPNKTDSNFTLKDLDHVFEEFQRNWKTASRKEREEMLKFIRQLAKDDIKDGVLIHKALVVLWDFAHSNDLSTDIMEYALSIHVEILFYLRSQDRNAQIMIWLNKCVEELKNKNKWTLPALNQIMDICYAYEDNLHRQFEKIIHRIENQHGILSLIINSLKIYMNKVRQFVKEHPKTDEKMLKLDGHYDHEMQVKKRLDVFRFLVTNGNYSLGIEKANEIWQCLVNQAIFPVDRENSFECFFELIYIKSNLASDIMKDFFQQNILQLDPTLLTERGYRCFLEFSLYVNDSHENFKDFIGIDYLWQVVASGPESTAIEVFEWIKRCHTSSGTDLQMSESEIRRSFIVECKKRLQAHCNVLSNLTEVTNIEEDNQTKNKITMEAQKMSRIMKFMQKYINECGWKENKNNPREYN